MGYRDGKYDVYRAKVVKYNVGQTNKDGSSKENLSLSTFANVTNGQDGGTATFQFENYEDAKAAYDALLAEYNTSGSVSNAAISNNHLG